MDLSASIVAAAGVAVPTNARLEGIDLIPILAGRSPEVERTLFWRTAAGGLRQRAVRKGDWKMLIDGNVHTLLFNVRKDVGERNDLASTRTDLARELRALLAGWETDVDEEAKRSRP